ncbi:hypothetical protein ABIE44_002235 [Marmoricola sp. OAE513]|uniref:Ig-like domain repeat protein n=1 Tax=Marmoricola sp. OAE513 TaxID=2817894 RepID=UPI001AE3780C
MQLTSRPWRALAATLSAGLVAGTFAAFTISPAVAVDSNSGDNFTVEKVPGGYEVTVELDKPLPIRDDAPSLEADGKSLGIAKESKDGKELSLVTTDASVLSAETIEAGWASQPPGVSTSRALTDVPESAAAAIDEDPTSIGSYEWTEATYNFGAQSIPMAGIGGIRGELQGKIYLPDSGGARPTVILLHGRHTSCSQGTANPNRWPCGANQINVPSYKGYDGTGRALASHGYAVVSIAANAINANDAQLTLDNGALARGQLILDSIAMLDKASKNQNPTYHDAQFDKDVTLAEALGSAKDPNDPADADTPDETLTPAQLVGRFDLTNIGVMGHSRGGEGATAAVTLNQALPTPWGITSVLPLAPVDFGRMTVADIPMQVILPYCDGDVSNQQGQHMIDDSRYAFGDDVLRSAVWVMGANHNFFNTRWTPAKYPYSTSDDWSNSTTRTNDTICGTAPAVAATSIRLTPDQQYQVGTAWMAGWFRMTMGGENQFLPLFDGSGAVPTTVPRDVRSFSTAPASKRNTITTFESTSSLIRTVGTATATPCASLAGRTVPVDLAYCATTSASAMVPHWTPASFGGNVPATPMTRMAWTGSTGEVRVTVPAGKRDQSGYQRLSVKVAADESVTTGTDVTLTVKDGAGASYSSLVSALNPFAVTRFPTSANSTTLKKVVLSQVNVPVTTLATAGLNVSDIREVSFKAATGADALATGAVLLSDLAFESSSVGTAVVKKEATLNVAPTVVEEGNGPGTADVAVFREGSTSGTAVGWVSVLGSATGRGGILLEKVAFAPGETCKVVTAPILGDAATSTSNSTLVKTTVINTSGAVMGDKAFTNVTVREDDGVTGSATALPPAGVQGNPCAEKAAAATPTALSFSDTTPAPGQQITVTGSGYRPGEGVTFSVAGTPVGVGVANASGVVELPLTLAADAAYGPTTISSVGAGSALTGTGSVTVLATTTTSLELAPSAPKIKQAVTLTATVEGDETAGTVQFFDGATLLGSAPTVDGVATFSKPSGFLAGTHDLVAKFGATATAQASESGPVSITLVKGAAPIVMAISTDASTYGTAVTGQVSVGAVGAAEVTVKYGTSTVVVPLTNGSAGFTLPATLAPGSYTVTAQYLGSDELEASPVASAPLTVSKKPTTLLMATSRTSSTFGTVVTGQVSVSESSASSVTVKYGSTTTVVPLANGAGKFSLPATLAPGSYTVTAQFLGTSVLEASAIASAPLVVGKRPTSVGVSGPSTAKGGKSLTVTFAVAGSVAGTYPAGDLKIYQSVGGGAYKLVSTRTLTQTSKGIVKLTTTAPASGKDLRYKATYVGNASFAGSSSGVKTVVVSKKK